MKCRYWSKYGLVSAVLVWCLAVNAYADSIRCGRAVVKVGDSTNVLLKNVASRLTNSQAAWQFERMVTSAGPALAIGYIAAPGRKTGWYQFITAK